MNSYADFRPRGNSRLRLFDLLGMATGSLRGNRLRSALTMFGIAIGVFSVVSVMTALSAMKQNIDSGLAFLGANVFTIDKYPAIMINDGWWNYQHRPNITVRQGQRFAALMGDEATAISIQMMDWGERVRYRDRKTGSNQVYIGADADAVFTDGLDIERGRFLSQTDVEFSRPVVVVGYDVVDRLFPNEDPLGKQVMMETQKYTIIGILERRGEMFGESRDKFHYVPITRFQMAHGGRWQSADIKVQAASLESFGHTQDMAIGAMRIVRGLEPEEKNDFAIYSNDSMQDAFGQIAVVVGTGGLLISVIALITAGVGIMNIMLVSVTERTREIGVRKSIGARSSDVLKQFLIESVFLANFGGLFGIIFGAIVGNVVASMLNTPMIFPWFWAGVAVAVCSNIGIVFGLYPAWKAARLHPIDALRYE